MSDGATRGKVITETLPERAISEQQVGSDGPWRSLVFGVAAVVLGLAPIVAADGPAGAAPSTPLMTLGFLGLALRFWRVTRGPIRALPALFVTTVGLAILVGASVAALSHSPDRAWATAGFAVGYLALGALAFVLITGESQVMFTLGCALLYLPALYWLAGLLHTVLGEVGVQLGSYVPYLLAALMGLALGKLGWSTAPRLVGWLGVFLILTVGVAAQATLEVIFTLGSQEQLIQWFWLSVASLITPAGIAMVVGILIALIDARRR